MATLTLATREHSFNLAAESFAPVAMPAAPPMKPKTPAPSPPKPQPVPAPKPTPAPKPVTPAPQTPAPKPAPIPKPATPAPAKPDTDKPMVEPLRPKKPDERTCPRPDKKTGLPTCAL